jgi:MFS family permease
MPRNVWVLSGISLAVAVGFGVVSPVLPMFATSFGVDEFAAGAVISVFALMRFATAPFVGRMDDRWGHRAVLMAGLLIVAVSSAAAGAAADYPALIVMRGLGGIGSAMFSVAGMTVLLASVDAEHRGRASGIYQGGFLVGAILGPTFGAAFAQISLRAPFFFYAGTLVVAALVTLGLTPVKVLRPEKPAPDEPERERIRPIREVVFDARFQSACLANLVHGWNTNGTRSTLVPLFIAAFLATTPAEAALLTGLAMAVAAGVQIVLVFPAGYVVDRYGRKAPMVLGALLAGVCLALIPASTQFAALTGLLALYALGSALLGTAPAAAVADAAGPGGDRALAVYSMTGDLGSILGPLAAGALAHAFGFQSAFLLGAGLWAVSALLSLRMPGRSR